MSQLPQLVDSHAHLDSTQFGDEQPQLVARALENGISHILTIGCDLTSSKASVALAAQYPQVYAAVGVHPHDATTVNDTLLDELRTLAREDKVVAIGEIGLDFYRDRSPRDDQRRAFRAQLQLACELELPVIVHDRDAHDDVLAILREFKREKLRGVLHCFSGDVAFAKQCLELGFYISIAGPVTYPKNDGLREVVKAVSIDKLLVETDCPYLSPQKFRGKRNEPAYVRYTAEKIAEVKGLSIEDVARITSLNAWRLFGIGDIDQSTKIAYAIRNSLYLNITNRCTNSCTFCAKFKDFTVKGHQLCLEREPSVAEIKAAIGDPSQWDEVVFCGYGESLLRLEEVKQLAGWLKQRGIKVRINTDGQANLVHGRNILPELAGLVDSLSVSLNAADAATYQKWCRSAYGEAGYEAVKQFLRLAKDEIPEVTATAVTLPGLDIEACRKVAEEIGVDFREREFNELG
ncbi:MAG: radical SAM protein [Desulfuromonas sp.]|nr:MAG: radical SAM protein [Desulfuromonas sp.]